MKEKPSCTKRAVIAKSRLFTLESMDLTFSNGEQRVFERVKQTGHGAVLIVAITPDESLLLIREYSAGTDRYELAFPKGLIDAGETTIEAANRELQEETGFAAKRLTFIKRVSLAPGYFSAQIDVVVAEGLYPSFLEGDEPEPLEVVRWPLHEDAALLNQPDFTESRSIAALYLTQLWLKTRNKSYE